MRRRLLVWSALPALLVLGLAAKLLSLEPLAGHAAGAFDAKDAAAVGKAAEALLAGNIVERHKAPFAAGDAHALAGNFAAARLRFEDALELAPAGSPDSCAIRFNLVLAIELLGDGKLRGKDAGGAAALFAEALDIAGAAPGGCFSGGAAADAGEKLSEAEGRLNGKLNTAKDSAAEQGNAAEESAPEEPEADSPSPNQLEQLEQSARESQRERNNGRERSDYLEDSGTGPGVDRPW